MYRDIIFQSVVVFVLFCLSFFLFLFLLFSQFGLGKSCSLNGMPSSSKLTRWKHKFADYSVNIVYIRGAHNPVADALSRQGWPHHQQMFTCTESSYSSSPSTAPFQGGGEMWCNSRPPTLSLTLSHMNRTVTVSLLLSVN